MNGLLDGSPGHRDHDNTEMKRLAEEDGLEYFRESEFEYTNNSSILAEKNGKYRSQLKKGGPNPSPFPHAGTGGPGGKWEISLIKSNHCAYGSLASYIDPMSLFSSKDKLSDKDPGSWGRGCVMVQDRRPSANPII